MNDDKKTKNASSIINSSIPTILHLNLITPVVIRNIITKNQIDVCPRKITLITPYPFFYFTYTSRHIVIAVNTNIELPTLDYF